MRKVLIIGCPGGGKSTFARALAKKTGLPLYYLDRIYHRADRTVVSREEFDQKLGEILEKEAWIIDGNYLRTIPRRLEYCDSVFWLRYPTEVCLEGVAARFGRPREDMPWVEVEKDEEFLQYIRDFEDQCAPRIEGYLAETEGKEKYVFTCREQAAEYLKQRADGCKR